MVVNDKDHIDVYLNMLPYKWQFAIAKSVKGAMEASKKAEASECTISEASLPKSVNLLKRLISFYNGPDVLILDCFVGSGATVQAVRELNEEDGGNRHFIMATNNKVSP